MIHHPYTVEIDDSIHAAEQIMTSHRIRHLPVVNNGKVVGIISDRDIHVAKSSQGANAAKLQARDLCQLNPYIVNESDSIETVVRTMGVRKIEVAVVARDDTPVGIFTTTDACRLLAELLGTHHEKGGIWTKLFGN